MRKSSPILLLLAAGLLAGCASGPPPPQPRGGGGPPRPRLFVSPAGQPFRPAPGGEAPLDSWWRQADRDGDGVLTVAELKADFDGFFRTLDRDGDGTIDGFEVTRYENEIVPEIIPDVGGARAGGAAAGPQRMGGGGARRGGGRRGGGPPGGGSRGGPRAGGAGLAGFGVGRGAALFSLTRDPEPVMAADYDLSRRISLAEFERRAQEVFALLDQDHDGRLAPAELPQPPEPAGPGRRRR